MSNKENTSLLSWDAENENESDAEFETAFQNAASVPQACSIDNPDCEACQ